LKTNRWIDTKDRDELPRYMERVLISNTAGLVSIGWLTKTDKHGLHWNDDALRGLSATHWQPLPKPASRGT